MDRDGMRLLCDIDWEGWLVEIPARDAARGGGGVADAKMVSRRARPRVGGDMAEEDGGGTDMVRGGPEMLASRLAAVVSDPPVPPEGCAWDGVASLARSLSSPDEPLRGTEVEGAGRSLSSPDSEILCMLVFDALDAERAWCPCSTRN